MDRYKDEGALIQAIESVLSRVDHVESDFDDTIGGRRCLYINYSSNLVMGTEEQQKAKNDHQEEQDIILHQELAEVGIVLEHTGSPDCWHYHYWFEEMSQEDKDKTSLDVFDSKLKKVENKYPNMSKAEHLQIALAL